MNMKFSKWKDTCQDAGHELLQATIRVAAPLTGPRDFYGSMAQTAPEAQSNMGIGQGDVETDTARWFEIQKSKWVVKFKLVRWYYILSQTMRRYYLVTKGSLEVKLPKIWTDQEQKW